MTAHDHDQPRIAILTGGGDVPGLNAVIKSVVYRATEAGYDGPRHPPRLGGPDPRPARAPSSIRGYLRPLDRTNTRTIDRTGGTILHTSRTNPRKMRARRPAAVADDADQRARYAIGDDLYDLTPLVLDNLAALGIDVLVTIGGDDTLSYSQVLVNAGVPLVAIPKTMDNDVQGTEYCIGFSTAITRAKEAINRQRTTLGSARADRRLPDLRARRRVLGAVHGLRHVGAVRRSPRRRTTSTRSPRSWPGPRREPEPLRVRHHRRGRDLEGRPDGRASGSADAFGHRHKANVGEALADELRARTGHRDARLGADLRPAHRRARLDRLDGRDDVRERRDGPRRGRRDRPDGRDPGRQVRAHGAARPGARAAQGRRAGACTTPTASGRATTGKLGDPMLLVGLD